MNGLNVQPAEVVLSGHPLQFLDTQPALTRAHITALHCVFFPVNNVEFKSIIIYWHKVTHFPHSSWLVNSLSEWASRIGVQFRKCFNMGEENNILRPAPHLRIQTYLVIRLHNH